MSDKQLKKEYKIKTQGNPNHWVYEYTKNGVKAIGCFNNYDEAERFVKMMKHKDSFMEEVRKGNMSEEEIPF